MAAAGLGRGENRVDAELGGDVPQCGSVHSNVNRHGDLRSPRVYHSVFPGFRGVGTRRRPRNGTPDPLHPATVTSWQRQGVGRAQHALFGIHGRLRREHLARPCRKIGVTRLTRQAREHAGRLTVQRERHQRLAHQADVAAAGARGNAIAQTGPAGVAELPQTRPHQLFGEFEIDRRASRCRRRRAAPRSRGPDRRAGRGLAGGPRRPASARPRRRAHTPPAPGARRCQRPSRRSGARRRRRPASEACTHDAGVDVGVAGAIDADRRAVRDLGARRYTWTAPIQERALDERQPRSRAVAHSRHPPAAPKRPERGERDRPA